MNICGSSVSDAVLYLAEITVRVNGQACLPATIAMVPSDFCGSEYLAVTARDEKDSGAACGREVRAMTSGRSDITAAASSAAAVPKKDVKSPYVAAGGSLLSSSRVMFLGAVNEQPLLPSEQLG